MVDKLSLLTVSSPDDAPELDILAQLYLTARLDPGCEELSAGQLAEQADLRLELVTTSTEYCWRLLFHPETEREILLLITRLERLGLSENKVTIITSLEFRQGQGELGWSAALQDGE